MTARTIIVTGGAGGIGQALVRAFVAASHQVGICDINAEAVLRLERELGETRALGQVIDVADPTSCAQAVERVARRFGTVHAVINNAALGMVLVRRDHFLGNVRVEDITPDLWQRFIAVNLSGAFFMAKAAMPFFRAQHFGRVINVTTSFFTMLRGGFSPYGPAKAGLEAWTASLAAELRGTGITANVVVPGGPADTPMVPTDSFPDRAALIPPEQMAPPMLYLLSDEAAEVTGQRFVAAHWDPTWPIAEAAAHAGAPAAWPDLAQSPVWPGGKPAS
ncbi:MAG TPA: SDR family oxidoreductase [Acetobacteraceae bacterium]|jgi:NAD(P)-dependent dehydrogenase (short-subunit alcohol dehydrogenase family)|nr:SDR family oxidoreductase [Acetobacteraceae bacterium]